MKAMKRNRIGALAAALFAALLLCACTVKHFDQAQADEITNQGQALLEAYLATLPEPCEMGKCAMQQGEKVGSGYYAGSYLSSLVRCTFEAGGRRFTAIADTATGRVWSNYYLFDMNEAVARQLRPYFERCGYTGDIRVTGAETYYRIITRDVPTGDRHHPAADSEVILRNLLPAEFDEADEAERAAAFLSGAPITAFTVTCSDSVETLLDPRVLGDYLRESGNYLTDADFDRLNTEYAVFTASAAGDGDTAAESWLLTLTVEGDPDEAVYSLERRGRRSRYGITVTYTSGACSGRLSDGGELPLEEYDCPVEFEAGRLSYVEAPGTARLLFAEKPAYTEFTRTVYRNGQPQEPEALKVVELDGGSYSLDIEGRTLRFAYTFGGSQEITFR